MDAAPPGFLCVTDVLKRTLENGNLRLPRFAGDAAFTGSQQWRARGVGIVTVHPLLVSSGNGSFEASAAASPVAQSSEKCFTQS